MRNALLITLFTLVACGEEVEKTETVENLAGGDFNPQILLNFFMPPVAMWRLM